MNGSWNTPCARSARIVAGSCLTPKKLHSRIHIAALPRFRGELRDEAAEVAAAWLRAAMTGTRLARASA